MLKGRFGAGVRWEFLWTWCKRFKSAIMANASLVILIVMVASLSGQGQQFPSAFDT